MNEMNSHYNGDAAYHREQRGIKTPEELRIEALEAEVKRLKSTERFLRSERPMARKMTELEAELAECKRDAERYRAWRYEFREGSCEMWNAICDANSIEEHDAAIDAAIADMGEKK